mmetsp:Transcript_246/g.479  ORF Transcript_246/g.479 Transcript_246/m.479 type:complete len:177 (+) Transcript_246:1847-2377(+)
MQVQSRVLNLPLLCRVTASFTSLSSLPCEHRRPNPLLPPTREPYHLLQPLLYIAIIPRPLPSSSFISPTNACERVASDYVGRIKLMQIKYVPSAFHANATARSATAATTTSMMPSILPVAPAFRAADLPLNQDIGSVLVNATWELGGVGDDDATRPTNVTPPPMIMVDVDVDGCLC